LKDPGPWTVAVYQADTTMVVLGRATPRQEVRSDLCEAQGVPVLRRAGGGGAVVLSPGTVIISAAGVSGIPLHPREHMLLVNGRIIEALTALGVPGLRIQGISDITLHNSKVLGSSLYRRKDIVLYQGSLLVNPDLELIDRYLEHPGKEPVYRQGRPHRSFVTSLEREGFHLDPDEVAAAVGDLLARSNPWKARADVTSNG
jgi:lipoate-protein ligase A